MLGLRFKTLPELLHASQRDTSMRQSPRIGPFPIIFHVGNLSETDTNWAWSLRKFMFEGVHYIQK